MIGAFCDSMTFLLDMFMPYLNPTYAGLQDEISYMLLFVVFLVVLALTIKFVFAFIRWFFKI